jgi:mannose-6-phosphate isomerase-like protein (cupin superfamily)
VHEAAEDVIYIVSGSGRLDTPKGSVELVVGTSVFSPPVVPGSYETGTG